MPTFPANRHHEIALDRAALKTVHPNPGHGALATLQRKWPGEDFTLITQNVDGLHQAAGSRRVLELHGSLHRVRCSDCHEVKDWGSAELEPLPHCRACG